MQATNRCDVVDEVGRESGDISHIRGPVRPGELDRRIAALAAERDGVVSGAELVALGATRAQIRHRARAGRLHLLHSDVYAVGHELVSGRGRWRAALLACGPRSALSHQDAAVVWDLRRSDSPTIHVTTPDRTRRAPSGVRLHGTRRLDPGEVTVREGLRVTSVARTLLDLAAVLSVHDLGRAFETAELQRVLDLRQARALCERARGRRGVAALRSVVADHLGPPPELRSELERTFLALIRAAGLPEPLVNVIVAGYEVDFYWPDARLVVEIDGHAYHHTRGAFERDRERDAALQLAGCAVVRFTHRRLERDLHGVVDTVRRLRDARLAQHA